MLSVVLAGGCNGGGGADSSTTSGLPETTTGSSTTALVDTAGSSTTALAETTDSDEGSTTRASVDESSSAGTSTGDVEPGTTSTGPAGPVCGNGVVEDGEECDAADLAGLGCDDVDPVFNAGTLACDGACAFDTSGCFELEAPIEVCQVANLPIPEITVRGVSDVITLPPEVVGLTIVDVNVRVELNHTWIDDLHISVTSGTSVMVFDGICGFEDNINAWFDDQAFFPFQCGNTDAGLTVLPDEPLSAFDGSPLAADWTLLIQDLTTSDGGILEEWCVTIKWI